MRAPSSCRQLRPSVLPVWARGAAHACHAWGAPPRARGDSGRRRPLGGMAWAGRWMVGGEGVS